MLLPPRRLCAAWHRLCCRSVSAWTSCLCVNHYRAFALHKPHGRRCGGCSVTTSRGLSDRPATSPSHGLSRAAAKKDNHDDLSCVGVEHAHAAHGPGAQHRAHSPSATAAQQAAGVKDNQQPRVCAPMKWQLRCDARGAQQKPDSRTLHTLPHTHATLHMHTPTSARSPAFASAATSCTPAQTHRTRGPPQTAVSRVWALTVLACHQLQAKLGAPRLAPMHTFTTCKHAHTRGVVAGRPRQRNAKCLRPVGALVHSCCIALHLGAAAVVIAAAASHAAAAAPA